jgi:hypothetical protein
MADLDKRGDFVGMVAAARAQLAGDASDSSAQFALARGSYFNGDFALATTELSKLTQAPPFAQDAEALEMLRVSSYLNLSGFIPRSLLRDLERKALDFLEDRTR